MGELNIQPDLVGQPEAATAVFPDWDYGKQLMQVNAFLFTKRLKEAEAKQKAVKDAVDNMDFNTAGVWERDIPEIKKKIDDYIAWHRDPNNLRGITTDLAKATERAKLRNEINFTIDKSKLDKKTYDEWDTKNKTDWQFFGTDNREKLDGFKSENDIINRKFPGLTPNIGADDPKVISDFKTSIAPKRTITKEDPSTGNQTVITETEKPSWGNVEGGIDMLANGKSEQSIKLKMEYADLMQRAADKTGHPELQGQSFRVFQDPEVDPKKGIIVKGFSDVPIEQLTLKDYINSKYVPSVWDEVVSKKLEGNRTSLATGGAGKTDPNAGLNTLYNFGNLLYNKPTDLQPTDLTTANDKAAGKGTQAHYYQLNGMDLTVPNKNYTGKNISVTKNGTTVSIPDQKEFKVSGIVEKGGKRYFVPEGYVNEDGLPDYNAVTKDDKFLVKNWWMDVVVPQYKKMYGASSDKYLRAFAADQYASSPGLAKQLGIPASYRDAGTSTSTTTTGNDWSQYEDNTP